MTKTDELQQDAVHLQGYLQGAVLILENHSPDAPESRLALHVLLSNAEAKAKALSRNLDCTVQEAAA